MNAVVEQPINMDLHHRLGAALRRLCKWRGLYARWWKGTDPRLTAAKDNFERTILTRTELAALSGLLMKKGFFTRDELMQAMLEQAEWEHEQQLRRFPGFQTTETDLRIVDTARAAETIERFGFKP